MLRRVRTTTGLLLTAALALPVGPARAGAVTLAAFDLAGNPVSAGDVVGRGTPTGDRCVFSDPAQVVTRAPGEVVLRLTDDCEMVVVRTSAADVALDEPPGAMVVPAVNRSATVPSLSPPATEVHFSSIPLLEQLPNPRRGWAMQSIYDPSGHVHFREKFGVIYSRHPVTGKLYDRRTWDGYCSANPHQAAPLVVNEVDPRSCYYWVNHSSPEGIVVDGGGRYRQRLAADLDPAAGWFATGTTLVVYAGTEPRTEHHCGIAAGELPPGLEFECESDDTWAG